jgi:hypothetical protein
MKSHTHAYTVFLKSTPSFTQCSRVSHGERWHTPPGKDDQHRDPHNSSVIYLSSLPPGSPGQDLPRKTRVRITSKAGGGEDNFDERRW